MKPRPYRPKLDLPKTQLEKSLEILAVLVLLTHLGMTFYAFKHSPDIVPTHFGIDGKPNGFGNKKTLWLLPLISLFLQAFLSLIGNAPETFNYLTELTPENVEKEYRFSRTFLKVVGCSVALVFLTISYFIIKKL
jgi:uncharacterized membrane protein